MFTCGLLRSNFSLLIFVSVLYGHRLQSVVLLTTQRATSDHRLSLRHYSLEPAMRFELMTSSLPRRRSTPELRGPVAQVLTCVLLVQVSNRQVKNSSYFGAGDETRTRDPQLGRLMLYQLSYTRPLLRSEISN